MSSNVKILKKRKISGVVVGPENIRELAKKVYKEYSQDAKKDQNVSIEFILKSSDGTQYESEKMEIFSKEGILDNRRIVAIEMGYHNYSKDKRISIDLEHTTRDWSTGDEVIVSGRDEIWANGILKMIEEIVSGWKKQVNWPHRYKWPLSLIFSIMMCVSLWLLLHSISSFFPSTPELLKEIPSLVAICWVPAFFLGFYIFDKIRRLYPHVEFMMGPEYSHAEQRKRDKIYKVVWFVILPFLLLAISLIIDVVRILKR